jgi:hypothetical protein
MRHSNLIAATLILLHGRWRLADAMATGSSAFGADPGRTSSELRQAIWRQMALVGLCGLSLLLLDDGCLAADPNWSIEPYYYFLHWVSVRRFDLALDQFADDAVVVSGPGCPLTKPCVGRPEIRKGYLSAVEAGRVKLPVPESFDGERLTTRAAIVDATECGHLVRLHGSQVFAFRDSHIASIRVALDASDPVTAAYMARQAAQGALAHAPCARLKVSMAAPAFGSDLPRRANVDIIPTP